MGRRISSSLPSRIRSPIVTGLKRSGCGLRRLLALLRLLQLHETPGVVNALAAPAMCSPRPISEIGDNALPATFPHVYNLANDDQLDRN